MNKDQLKEIFHLLFNKINNIFTAVGSNKIILEEKLDKLSVEELKERIRDLLEALIMIEKNALVLNSKLQDFYETLTKETNPTAAD
jgi:hypothetical protein